MEGREAEVMEGYVGRVQVVDVVVTVETEFGLAVMCRGADVVDGDPIGGHEVGEVEELVQMALDW